MKILLFFILSALSVYGQEIIKGSVTDSLTAGQLKGAEIILTGTNYSTVSNFAGEFYLSGIPAGEYILQASYLGYEEKKYLIDIKSKETLSLNIELLPNITIENGTTLAEQAKSQAEEINLIKSSNTIRDIISGQKLQEMPDENLPLALSRLPGVSIVYRTLPFINSLITSGGFT